MASLTPGRRQAILQAALACFNERGIEAAPIAAIGKRAGASVGSMYHHFGNKDGIAVALMVEGLQQTAELQIARLSGAQSQKEVVAALIESIVSWVESNPEWARFIYTVSSSQLMQRAQAELEEINARYQQLLAPHLAHTGLPAEAIPSLVLGPVHDYARRWLAGQVAHSPVKYQALFVETAQTTLQNMGLALSVR